jgi:kynurenine 3-monooxygenase
MWPRNHFMLLGVPNTDETFTCSLHMSFEGPTSFATLKTKEQIAAFFQETFPDVPDHVPDLAEQFMSSPVNPMVSVRCSPWTVGNKVTLLGDAAHVLFPYYGQGANAGFEDCVFLMQCLDDANGEWQTALRQYEQSRKPNMDVISDLCKEHYVELRRSLADPLFVFRKRIERRVSEKYPRLFQPLYSMIAFTCMSYVEAVAIYQEQSQIIDRILASSDMEPDWSDARIDAAIDETLQPVGLAAAAFAQAPRA